jgi:hypothetical protein
VHQLSHDQPKTTTKLVNITTRHTSSEEGVMAVFIQGDGRLAPSGNRGVPLKEAGKGAKRSAKSNKRRPKRRPQRVAVTTSSDEGNNDKEPDDSDEEIVAATVHNLKCQAQQVANHFEKLLEEACPNL